MHCKRKFASQGYIKPQKIRHFIKIIDFFPEIHAYDNSAFNSGSHEMEERRVDSKAEVERLGYEMYNGKHENR